MTWKLSFYGVWGDGKAWAYKIIRRELGGKGCSGCIRVMPAAYWWCLGRLLHCPQLSGIYTFTKRYRDVTCFSGPSSVGVVLMVHMDIRTLG